MDAHGGAMQRLAAAADAQTPTARALRNTRAVNLPNAESGLVDPAVMSSIQQLAGVLDQNGGMASPMNGGRVAELTGRMPVMTQGFGQPGAPLPPELEQALVDMAQPRDPAVAPMDAGRAYNLRKSAAKAKADAIAAEAESNARRESSFTEDHKSGSEIAQDNDMRNWDMRMYGGPGGGPELHDTAARKAREMHSPEAYAKRDEAFQRARNNVALMSMAGGVSRAARMGDLPKGVDPAGILGAIAPTQDMQMQINPGPTGQLRGIEAFDRDSQRDAAAQVEAQKLASEAEKFKAKLLLKGQKGADATSVKTTRMTIRSNEKLADIELKAGEEGRKLQADLARAQMTESIAAANLALAQTPGAKELAALKLEEAKMDVAQKKKQHEENMRVADLAIEEAKADPFPAISDPHKKSEKWGRRIASDAAVARQLNEIPTEGLLQPGVAEGSHIPEEVANFLSHVYDNRDTLYSKSTWRTDEQDFMRYVAARLPGVKRDKAYAIARSYYQSR